MILNVNKPKDWTSFDVVKKLKGVFGVKKIGHAGTLDPLATGVLVILTDEDTKKQEEIMKLEKEYVAQVAFGAKSLSYDLETDLIYSDNKFESIPIDILQKYIGTYEQTVPAYSATKQDGQRLYKRARAGEEIKELPKKEVTVEDIKLEKIESKKVGDRNLPVATLGVTCSKGFYVRSLAHDLGEDLGTGAVLVDLVRTKVGNYSVEDSKEISSF